MWEYHRIEISIQKKEELDEVLDDYGSNDWEIIYFNETKPIKYGAPYNCIVLFKRTKKSQQNL